jgi:TonB-dependent receptor
MFNRRLLSLVVALSASGALHAQEATDDDALLEEVVVQGVRQAELNARQAERNKESFSSIIAQDDAGNFADQNVAESLQRLPGITLQKSEGEGQRINLRGLGPQYVNVTMNGSELASAGGDDRSFGLDVISSDMLGGVEVNKTILPSMDTYSTAGSVNLKTISAFDKKRDSLKLKAQVNNQSYSGELNPKFSLNGTNLLADETFGVGYSLSAENRKTVNYENLHHSSLKPQYVDPEADGTPMLIPFESQMRQEDAERTRMSGSLDLGWRPTENSEYKFQVSRTQYEDDDIAMREYYRFYGGGTGSKQGQRVFYTNPSDNTFLVTDAEVQQQFFIQESEVVTDALSLEGENTFADSWTVDYRLAYSSSTNEKPDGRRVQFRIRDVPMMGAFGEDYIGGQPLAWEQAVSFAPDLASVSPGDVDAGNWNSFKFGANGAPLAEQGLFAYDNIFLEESVRKDTISSFNLNLQKDFNDSVLSYVKAGLQVKSRDREADRNRVSLNPSDYSQWCNSAGLPVTEEEQNCRDTANSARHDSDYVSTYLPEHPEFNFAHITRSSAEALLSTTRALADNYDPNQTEQESRAEDYEITEATNAFYVEAKFEFSDTTSMITGIRYNATDFESTGNFTLRNDRYEDSDTSNLSKDIVIPLEGTAKSYTDIHPSVHFMYEPSDEYQYRAALWTSGTRPGFDQARARAKFSGRLDLCLTDAGNAAAEINDPELGYDQCSDNPASEWGFAEDDLKDFTVVGPENTIDMGNPVLEPMFSINFDASLGWYPNDDLTILAAFFYKDIKDFIVDVRGKTSSAQNLPVSLPLDQIPYYTFSPDTEYGDVNFYDNGDKASVWGLELSYSQYFEYGVFIQSNATLLDSEADMGQDLRADTIKMPNMAATTVNFVLGWENDIASARVITNYASEILDQVGSCTSADIDSDAGGIPIDCETWNDVYYKPALNIDVKATYNVTDDVSLYFDAINVTGERTNRYMEGNQYSGGNIMYWHEDFGPSVQVGVNWTIY